MNNIQKVIEESLKKLDEIIDSFDDWVETEDGEMYSPDINKKQLKSHLTTTISKVLSAIGAEVKHLPNGFPIPEEVLTLVTTKHPILRNAHVARAGYNIAVDEFQELLQSAKEQIR